MTVLSAEKSLAGFKNLLLQVASASEVALRTKRLSKVTLGN